MAKRCHALSRWIRSDLLLLVVSFIVAQISSQAANWNPPPEHLCSLLTNPPAVESMTLKVNISGKISYYSLTYQSHNFVVKRANSLASLKSVQGTVDTAIAGKCESLFWDLDMHREAILRMANLEGVESTNKSVAYEAQGTINNCIMIAMTPLHYLALGTTAVATNDVHVTGFRISGPGWLKMNRFAGEISFDPEFKKWCIVYDYWFHSNSPPATVKVVPEFDESSPLPRRLMRYMALPGQSLKLIGDTEMLSVRLAKATIPLENFLPERYYVQGAYAVAAYTNDVAHFHVLNQSTEVKVEFFGVFMTRSRFKLLATLSVVTFLLVLPIIAHYLFARFKSGKSR